MSPTQSLTDPALAVYNSIKQAESENTIFIPQSSQTVHVGTFDASTGIFSFDVQTGIEYYIYEQDIGTQQGVDSGLGSSTGSGGPPKPPGAPTGSGVGGGGKRTILPQTNFVPLREPVGVGYVLVYAMDLQLSFSVSNPGPSFSVTMNGETSTIGLQASPLPPVAQPETAGVFSTSNTITIDVGSYSTPYFAVSRELPGTPVMLQSGVHSATIRIRVLRPPCCTAGAFTIPALPTVIVYAPPPGPENKNTAQYMHTTSVSSKVSTTLNSATSTKQSVAYSASDFVNKLIGFGTDIANFAVTVAGFAGGGLGSFAGGGSGSGASAGGGSGNKAGGGSAADDLKAITSGIKFVQDLVDGLSSSMSSTTTNGITSGQEDDLQTTDSTTITLQTPVGFGPGVGDRIGIVLNARVAWAIVDGQLSFTVLGSDGTRAYAIQTLQADLGLLTNGMPVSGTQSQLDADTIRNLLQLDPLANVSNLSSSLLQAPRFIVNDPASIGGSGTGPSGDQENATHTVSNTDTQTTQNTTVTFTDTKPGWLTALFGVDSNVETQTTATSTYSSALAQMSGQTITSSVTMYAPTNESNMISVYFDTLFGTFVYLPYGA